MRSLTRSTRIAAAAAGIALAASALPLAAQSRVLPAGTVILVKTLTPLESNTAQVGQTFETTVDQDVAVDAYSVIPAGSRIRALRSPDAAQRDAHRHRRQAHQHRLR